MITGLLPTTAFDDHYAPKVSLMERMAFYHTPGVSIAVINDFRIEWARGFGVKEWGKSEPVIDTTLFQAGSIGKPIFAMAAMRLVQQGKLNLDEDVNHYLTSWKVPPTGSWQPRVTLRQLLSHTAGFTAHGFLGYEAKDKLPTLVDVIEGRTPAQTPPLQINIMPGTQFRYSGGGITVAQQTVEDVVHQPLPGVVRDLVLDPLEMKHSTYEQPLPKSWQREAATSHPWKNHPIVGKWYVHPENAAAGFWTTPTDLARATLEIQLAVKGNSNCILTAQNAAEMITPRADQPVGIGFFSWGRGENAMFGHTGKNEGAEAFLLAYKKGGKGAVVMINSNVGSPLIEEIQRAFAREYQWPEFLPHEKKSIVVSSNILQSYVGEYTSKAGLKFSVAHEKGILLMRCADQPPVELRPVSETKFFISMLNSEVTFDRNEKSEATHLNLFQEGVRISAQRGPGEGGLPR